MTARGDKGAGGERRRDVLALAKAIDAQAEALEKNTCELRSMREEWIRREASDAERRIRQEELNGAQKEMREDLQEAQKAIALLADRYDTLNKRVNGWSAANSLGAAAATVVALIAGGK